MISFRQWRRPLIIAAGSLVALLGLILMPVPGPGGTLVFLAGLAILAAECKWAKDLLLRFKETHGRMGKRKRRILTASLLVFYLASGVVVWSLANRPGQAPARLLEKTDA